MDNTIQIRWVGSQISETKYMPKHQPEQGCQVGTYYVGTWLTRMSSRGLIHVYTQFLYLWQIDQHNTMRLPTVLLPKKGLYGRQMRHSRQQSNTSTPAVLPTVLATR